MSDLSEFLLARLAEREAELHPDGGKWEDPWGRPIKSPRTRILAELAAQRRIVERAIGPVAHAGQDIERRATLRDLASVYADHPDYRDEWRP